MTAAQRAMATAMVNPKGEQGAARMLKQEKPKVLGSSERLRQSRAVLSHSPPTATAVLAGSKSLDEAYSAQAAPNLRPLHLQRLTWSE
jgi:hypothetical protein